MNGRGPIRFLSVTALSLTFCAPSASLHAQTPAERIDRIDRQHTESLADLCRELDRALLEALPAWSDPVVRHSLFGVPTDTEREQLQAQTSTLASTIAAMQPLVERRLARADRDNGEGINQAVQLSEVLIPLARARGLLIAAAALEPTLTASDEATRAFQQALRAAELAESVSAWSDLERELITAIASLRLGNAEVALEAVRRAREAIHEDETLAALAPQSVRTLRATEAMLVAIARSPAEAREVLPDDEADRQRLRLRFAAISIRQARTADAASRLLQAEVDRLASEALDLARSNPFDDTSWFEPILRCEALLEGANLDALGETARAVTTIAEAADADQSAAVLDDPDLGPLTPIALSLQLRSLPPQSAASLDIDRITQLGLAFDRFAADTPLGDSALERVALLLRARIANDAAPLPSGGPSRDRLLDLIDILITRPETTRSNLDLLAAILITPAEPGEKTLRLIERVETIQQAAAKIEPNDADAARALAVSGATLVDALARNQAATVLDQDAIHPAQEARAINLLKDLAGSLRLAEGDEGLAVVMEAFALSEPADDLESLSTAQTSLVPDWIVAMLRTRAELLNGAATVDAATDGAVIGAALFVDRDLPENIDIRAAVPNLEQSLPPSSSATTAGSVLSTRRGTYISLAIRAFSVALHTDDPAALQRLREATLAAAPRAERPEDRVWLRLLHAEAALRSGDAADAFGLYRDLVATTAPEDRSGRAYWHASMRMLEILSDQNADGSRTPSIAREIRRLRLQPSWQAHPDICDRIDAIARDVITAE